MNYLSNVTLDFLSSCCKRRRRHFEIPFDAQSIWTETNPSRSYLNHILNHLQMWFGSNFNKLLFCLCFIQNWTESGYTEVWFGSLN